METTLEINEKDIELLIDRGSPIANFPNSINTLKIFF